MQNPQVTGQMAAAHDALHRLCACTAQRSAEQRKAELIGTVLNFMSNEGFASHKPVVWDAKAGTSHGKGSCIIALFDSMHASHCLTYRNVHLAI